MSASIPATATPSSSAASTAHGPPAASRRPPRRSRRPAGRTATAPAFASTALSRTRPWNGARTMAANGIRAPTRPPDARLIRGSDAVALHRTRPVILVDRDEGEQAFGDLDLGLAALAAGNDLDPDRDRGAADPLDPREDRDDVVQQDRGDELHRLDRDRGDRSVGLARGDDAGGDVHLAEHPAPEDVAVRIDVARPRHDPQDGLAPVRGHSGLPPPASSSWPLRLLRKTSPISPVPTSTVSPTPAIVATTFC